MRPVLVSLLFIAATSSLSCRPALAPGTPSSDAATLLGEANQRMLSLGNAAQEAGWVAATYITSDTEAISARANEAYVTAVTDFAKRAALLLQTSVSPDERRQLTVLKNTLTMAAPPDAREGTELAQIAAAMEGMYGRGTYCPGRLPTSARSASAGPPKPGEGGKATPTSEPAGATGEACLDVEAVTKILAESRDAQRLREVWEGWHTISPPMKQSYVRFVELSNKGAAALDFPDTGTMWRAKYDMPPDAFAEEMNRLWNQLRPLYLSLHAYVRMKLHQTYGDLVPADGPIPAHLLGNIWAQEWGNIFALVAPPTSSAGVPLDDILKTKNVSPADMVRYGERFFTSLGFEGLPATFWERSLLVKPRDRQVVCHASAWNINSVDDLRIKMCIDQTAEDFTVIHHELGHNFYARAYNRQPVVLREGANDGFHEAVGDTVALSVTPEYLVKVGLLDKAPDASGDIALLMQRALDKLAFLPFGLVVDQWRWRVFSGEVGPDDYNKAWWELRERYQGIRAPSPRGEQFFDAGAKYHIPANTPYARYFLASVLQFQFHRALAKTAGCTTPLHRCSIYGSAEAGKRLKTALEMGASKPWPDVLEALTGQRQMDASAIAEYYAPLKAWLDEQNQGQKLGW